MSTETDILIKRAAAELKTAGAREIYVFGSAAHGTGDAASDLDLAVSGLPPSVFYRMGARVSDLIGRSVDLIDLDSNAGRCAVGDFIRNKSSRCQESPRTGSPSNSTATRLKIFSTPV